MKSLVFWLLSLLLSWNILGCTIAEPPQLISISNPPAFRPRSPQQVKTLEQAMAAIVTVCSQDLGLPTVEPLYVHLYKDAAAYAGYTWSFARLPEQIVRLTAALPEENRLHINLERTRGLPWGQWVQLLAHEYAHNVEYVLTGPLRRGSQWIREGFADWVAFRVLNSLGWEVFSTGLERAKKELSRLKDSPPKLSDLENSQDWIRTVDQPKGRVMTYSLAFLAVDKLIQKKGIQGMLNYFKSEDFEGSFGFSWTDFERELRATVKDLAGAKPTIKDGFKAEKPEWKIGHQWQYAWKGPGTKGTVTAEVLREDTFEGNLSLVLRVVRNEHIYRKADLAFLATLVEGKTVVRRIPAFQIFSWPLEVSKEWRDTSVIENLVRQSSEKTDNELVVSHTEEVKVPAGTFKALKIEAYSFQTGSLVSEYWYAPEVKWFVKTRHYLPVGLREEELVSFRVD